MITIPLIEREDCDGQLVFNQWTNEWDLMKNGQRIRALDEYEQCFVESAYRAGQQSVTVTK